MRKASKTLSRLHRDPIASSKIYAYLLKPPVAISLSVIIFSLPLLLLSLVVYDFLLPMTVGATDNIKLIVGCFSWSVTPLTFGIILILRPAFQKSVHRVSDETFDMQLRYDVYQLSQRALHKIQINVPGASQQTQFPDTVICEPTLWCIGHTDRENMPWGKFDDAVPTWKKGRDGIVRYRIYRVAILYMAKHHLAYYLCDYNIETGLLLWEETIDCHYKDVAAINYEVHQVRSVDFPPWWGPLADVLSIFRISELFVVLTAKLVAAMSMQCDFSIRSLVLYLDGAKVSIPTLITEYCEQFENDNAVDPVVSKVRFLLQEKRMSYVRTIGPGESY